MSKIKTMNYLTNLNGTPQTKLIFQISICKPVAYATLINRENIVRKTFKPVLRLDIQLILTMFKRKNNNNNDSCCNAMRDI